DKKGIYSGGKGYYFESNDTLKDMNKAFNLDGYTKDFDKFYRELNLYQLAERLGISK
ncbi:LTA synthase family protein, partial [Campylobacter coli]|nr:LTA synthase family protein [Campylobacter coli]